MTKRLIIVSLLPVFLFCFASNTIGRKNNTSGEAFKRVDSDYALSGWEVVNDGSNDGPSNWYIVDGVITQSSNLYGGDSSGNNPDKPGTYALNGEKDWVDYNMSVELRSKDNDAIGIMFRYQDTDNYYRFSMDKQRKYRRLLKKVNGRVTVLAEDQFSYEMGRWYRVKVSTVGHQIEIYMDGGLVFSVTDNSLSNGRIGLYSWGNAGSEFRDLLMNLNSGFVIVDEGNIEGPSSWSISDGIIYQGSDIRGGNDRKDDPYKPGTYVINGDSSWSDYDLNLSVRSSDDDAIGVMFRYKDEKNYYRYSMDKERRYRRLIKKVNGQITVLAEDDTPYTQNMWYHLSIRVLKNTINVTINNETIFDVADSSISSGKVCIYCWGNSGSEYKDLVVTVLEDQEDNNEQKEINAPVANVKKSKATKGKPTKIKEIPIDLETDKTDNYVEQIGEDHFDETFVEYFESVQDEKEDVKLEDLSEIAEEESVEPQQTMVVTDLPDGWTVVDDGKYDQPSSWAMVDGVVFQSSNVYGGSNLAVSPVKPGTHLVSGNDLWKDYSFSGKMRSLDDDAIGVMFRYLDNDNYYRFSIDKQRQYRRLIKKVDGDVIILEEDVWEYAMNRWYDFKVTLEGDAIKIFLDEKIVFDVTDTDIPSGKIGRYCWGNEGGEFKEFEVLPFALIEPPAKKDNTNKDESKQQIVASKKATSNERKEPQKTDIMEPKMADVKKCEKPEVKECDKLVKLEVQLENLQKEVLAFRKECNCN